jgi:hypothetical protein
MTQNGQSFVLGVCQNKLILSYKNGLATILSYLVQNPVEKTKWWEDVIEHPFPGDGHCIHSAWPRQSWFPDLLLLSCAKPLRLPLRGDLLSQFNGKKLHQGLEKLHLHARLLSGRLSDREAFLKKQPSASL